MMHEQPVQVSNGPCNINHHTQSPQQQAVMNEIIRMQRQAQEYRMRKYYNENLGLSKRFRGLLKKMKITKTSQSCSICQETYVKDDIVIQLPCKHIFHKNDCIKGWLKVSSKCPVCKMDLEQFFTNQQKLSLKMATKPIEKELIAVKLEKKLEGFINFQKSHINKSNNN